MREALVAALIVLAAVQVAYSWEEMTPLDIYQKAYPVGWNGKMIMIGERLQLPIVQWARLSAAA